MRPTLWLNSLVRVVAIAALVSPRPTPAQSRGSEASKPTTSIQIPASIPAEHDAIQSALAEATRAPGRLGAAAKALAEVLHPHFAREEQIALPPLGLLAPPAAGTGLAAAQVTKALASAEQILKYEQLADHLALHVRTEEEVMCPAAVLVGNLLRVRRHDSR